VQLHALLPYTVLKVFEADNRSPLIYRILDPHGRQIDGCGGWRGDTTNCPSKGRMQHWPTLMTTTNVATQRE
jgi:hypothetical protein